MNTEKSIEEKQTKINWLNKEITFWRVVAVLFILSGFILPAIYHNGKLQLNEFGDYIGGTTGSLWGLAGLILVYVAFLGQKQQLLYQEIEIALNREELQSTREELKGQKEELAEQNKLNRLRRFEDTFFNFLSMINELANGFEETSEMVYSKIGTGNRKIEERQWITVKGKRCIRDYYHMLNMQLKQNGEAKLIHSKKEITPKAKIRKEFFGKNTQLSSYFNTIYQALNFVDVSEIIDEEGKDFYIGILSAQLSFEEKDMMFHYTSTDVITFYGFRSLLMRFNIYLTGSLTLQDIKNM